MLKLVVGGSYSRLPERNPELEGTEAIEQSGSESSGPNQVEWEAWLNAHNKLSQEMNETKHTLLTLQELVRYLSFFLNSSKYTTFCIPCTVEAMMAGSIPGLPPWYPELSKLFIG